MSAEASKEATPKRRAGRSPAYPFINVQKALQRSAELHQQEGDYAAPVTSAANAWGYSAKSSGARQTLATLRYYGLIEVTGDGDARKVKVSDTARRILLDQREDETEKKQLIRKVALNPSAHKTLYEQYPAGLASDGSVTHFLMFDAGFNKDAASELLSEFKETAEYAGLYQPGKSMDKNDQNSENGDILDVDVKVGDIVQWTSNGVDRFPSGGQILGFSEDGQWVFTDQGGAGIPLNEVSVIEASGQSLPPKAPPHLTALRVPSDRKPDEVPSPGSRKAVFPVDEGDVTLIFPENITADGLEELSQYLSIFLRKEQKKKSAED